MTNLDTIEREAFVLMLRSKTVLGRLNDPEVHSVLNFLEGIGFSRLVAPPAVAAPIEHAPVAPAPVVAAPIEHAPVPASDVLTPEMQVAAQVAQVLPVAPIVPPPAMVPVAAPAPSMLANLESIIEKDVKAFFEPAPIAPPPAQ